MGLDGLGFEFGRTDMTKLIVAFRSLRYPAHTVTSAELITFENTNYKDATEDR
jgi:hypothetical protein